MDWECPNCGTVHQLSVVEDKTCDVCGYSETLPEEDDNRGYY